MLGLEDISVEKMGGNRYFFEILIVLLIFFFYEMYFLTFLE